MWPTAIFALLALNMAIVATTITLAVTTDSAVVEERPYERALKWDVEQARRGASAALHWTCDARLDPPDAAGAPAAVRAAFTDAAGVPITGLKVRVVAFHHGHAEDRITLEARENSPGIYSAEFGPSQATPSGKWRLQVAAYRTAGSSGEAEAFECEKDIMVGAITRSEEAIK
jgi:nitrogen fixation protein FixH